MPQGRIGKERRNLTTGPRIISWSGSVGRSNQANQVSERTHDSSDRLRLLFVPSISLATVEDLASEKWDGNQSDELLENRRGDVHKRPKELCRLFGAKTCRTSGARVGQNTEKSLCE